MNSPFPVLRGILALAKRATIVITCLALLLTVSSEALAQKNKKMAKTIDSRTLWQAFSTDNEKAQQTYSGEWIITGYASYVGPDPYALPSVEVTDVKGGKSQVMCVLPWNDYLKLRKVSKGDAVRIKGNPLGYYEKGDQVVTKHCVILEVNGEKQ